ncbi:hypothetical protein quinque_007093 [Culex quinquefasciatus]
MFQSGTVFIVYRGIKEEYEQLRRISRQLQESPGTQAEASRAEGEGTDVPQMDSIDRLETQLQQRSESRFIRARSTRLKNTSNSPCRWRVRVET